MGDRNMGSHSGKAGVLIVLWEGVCDESNQNFLKVLLIKRMEGLIHHPGEVAFPGGMWEPEDRNLYHTALREANEELGLISHDVSFVGQLKPSQTRRGVLVHPFIVQANTDLTYLRADQEEIASLKWVDLGVFLSDKRMQTDIFMVAGKEYWAPVYQVADYRVWGFTARLLVEYVNHHYRANIERDHKSPEYMFSP